MAFVAKSKFAGLKFDDQVYDDGWTKDFYHPAFDEVVCTFPDPDPEPCTSEF